MILLLLSSLVVDAAPQRSAPPRVATPSLRAPPQIETGNLEGGVPIDVLVIPGAHRLFVGVVLDRGMRHLHDSGAAGDALAALWGRAGQGHDPDEVDKATHEAIGSLGIEVRGEATVAWMAAPSATAKDLAPLLRELLWEPRWPEEAVNDWRERYRELWLDELPRSSSMLVEQAMRLEYFPPEHPLGRLPDLSGARKIGPQDIEPLHRAMLEGASAHVVAVGDVSLGDVSGLASPLVKGLSPRNKGAPSEVHLIQLDRAVAVDQPRARTVRLRLAMNTPPLGNPFHEPFLATDLALERRHGGRLSDSLPDAESTSTDLRAGPGVALWHLDAEVAPDKTAESVRAVQTLLKQLSESGPPKGELSLTGKLAAQEWNNALASWDTASSWLVEQVVRGVDVAAEQQRAKRAVELSVLQAREGSQWLADNRSRLWVLVGDRGKLQKELDEIGLNVTWTTAEELASGEF